MGAAFRALRVLAPCKGRSLPAATGDHVAPMQTPRRQQCMLLCSLIWVGEIRLALFFLLLCPGPAALDEATLGRIKRNRATLRGCLRVPCGQPRRAPDDHHQGVQEDRQGSRVREDTRPYDLRKAFATRIISAGADLKTAMSLTWHTQVAVLMKYCGQGGCPRSSVRPWTRRWR